ncbi:hypothetical protein DERP_009787 [Dermatophagoides pteronyssinus]|uniref:Uncharacterized protein n=1 Tax=Dermatophagoides pteronyssinus TaxID=6956 RepID=A0ABQ8IR53_DERPT|nr:hypothetical protein DERP_009787 [Dermatophagoides pteronyssinus]
MDLSLRFTFFQNITFNLAKQEKNSWEFFQEKIFLGEFKWKNSLHEFHYQTTTTTTTTFFYNK